MIVGLMMVVVVANAIKKEMGHVGSVVMGFVECVAWWCGIEFARVMFVAVVVVE
jgi:hypothetical protein